MKRIVYSLVGLAVCMLLLGGCKKKDWLDWKVMNEMVLEANKSTKNVVVTGSGLQYHIISDNSPTEPRPDDESYILCTYTVKLPACGNKVVDSGTNATFALTSVVKGFLEGIKKIHKYGVIEMWIPYDIAYGEDGVGSEGAYNYIPPYSTVYFKVDLRDVTKY